MELSSSQLETIRIIFEEILKKEGYNDLSEICGDQTEDFCRELLKLLDGFYANI